MPSVAQVALSIINFLQPLYEKNGYLFVFIGSALENTLFFGWIFPGNIMASLGGFYAHNGQISLFGVMISSIVGSIIGKNFDFLLGRFFGEVIVKRFRLEKQTAMGRHFIRKHGAKAFFLTAITGALRSILMFTSGMMKVSYSWFISVVTITSIIWGIIIVLLGYFLGSNKLLLEKILSYMGVFGWVLIIGFIVWRIIESRKGKEIIKEDEILEKIDKK